MEDRAAWIVCALGTKGSCPTALEAACLGGPVAGHLMPLRVARANGMKCGFITAALPSPPSRTILSALRVFTSGLQFLPHLLLPWRLYVSFLLCPFESSRRGQKNGTSGGLALPGACITGCVKRKEEESDPCLL